MNPVDEGDTQLESAAAELGEKVSKITPDNLSAELQALMRSVVDQFENYAKLNRKLPAETAVQLAELDDPSRLADAVAANIAVKVADKQSLLVEKDPGSASKWCSPSWRASSACCRSRRRSAAA